MESKRLIQVLDRRYKITEVLASGGMGHALLADDLRLGVTQLIKVPKEHLL